MIEVKREKRKVKSDSLKLKTFNFWLSLFSFLFSLFAFAAEPAPAMLQKVGIEPRLGETIPLSLEFTNEAGQTVPLQTYFNGSKPVILVLAYYECPNLCTYVFNGMLEGLKGLTWNIGNEFQIVTVSINPKETPELAAKKKGNYLKEYWRLKKDGDRGRGPAQRVAEEVPEGVAGGGRFLVGKEENIRALAEAVGFRYAYDESIGQYAHAAGLFILTPEGKLARTLFGIQFTPRDLRLALAEASEGKIGSVIDKILLFCYSYDPKQSRYILFAGNLMKGGAAVTLLALGIMVSKLGRKKA